MNSSRLIVAALRVLVGVIVVGVSGHVVSTRQVQDPEVTYRGVLDVVHFDVSQPLGVLAQQAPARDMALMVHENPDEPAGPEGPPGPQDADAAVQAEQGSGEIVAPLNTFATLANSSGVTPPDPVGDVSANHYVVMSNFNYLVTNKSGALVLGPAANNTLWSGFGGACQTENAGDPIVIHDQISNRWLLTQFTSAGPNFFLCLALSTTSDPTGSYYRWAFSTGTNFPDYPKFGAWADAFYASTREFAGATGPFVGVGAYAFNRSQMVVGNPSPTVISMLVTPGATPYRIGDGLLPADLDGSALPPAGSPEFFLGVQDNGGPFGAPSDALNVWEFAADFVTPGNSTFTLASTVEVAAFDSMFPCAPAPNFRECIPQPGTTRKLDHQGYRQRLLHRAAYRNYGSHESIALNHSVEAAPNVSGVRWYELRSPNTSPIVYQQGTYAPSGAEAMHRWFGSIAMDQAGNMAVGYSVASGIVYPGIRFTARQAGDPLGQMTQGEGIIANGFGSQTGSARWGDYTSMNVDPSDDCTFWYTNQYQPSTSADGWLLVASSFRLPNCPASPHGFTRFDYDTPLAFPPDRDATVNVTGIAGSISQVRVSVHLTHTFDQDVDLLLRGPDGTTIELSTDNGGLSGDNYGQGCSPQSVRTTFDDSAPNLITDGPAPFIGSFRPEQALSAFTGKSGAAANGTWTLQVRDDFAAIDNGVLKCWSLFIDSGFHNPTLAPIPDLSTLNSPISVSGFNGPVGEVRVSFHITHPFDADLDIALVGPDGTTVELSSDNGSSDDNYGNTCAPDTSRTTFTDVAPRAITAGSAPFLGAYRPEQPLLAFRGKTGADVNGTWTLRVTDDANLDVGTLQCWSLYIDKWSGGDSDFDFDSDPDLLWQHPDGQAVAWIMDGTSYTGMASYLYASPLEWHLRGSTDFTNDGQPDLIWQHPDGRVVIWVMNGTTYTGDARYLYSSTTEWRLIGGADFTNDGKPDLVWQHPTGRVVIWVMDGTTYTGDARPLYEASTDWKVIGAADFTNDNKPDLVWQHPTGRAVIWVMDGTTYGGDARSLYSGDTEWILKGSADYTSDGQQDLIWQHPTGPVVIWVLNGTTYGGDARYLYTSSTEWKVVPR